MRIAANAPCQWIRLRAAQPNYVGCSGNLPLDHPNRTLCRVQIVTSPPPDRRLLAAAIRHKSRATLWLFRALGVVLLLMALLDLLISAVDVEDGVFHVWLPRGF